MANFALAQATNAKSVDPSLRGTLHCPECTRSSTKTNAATAGNTSEKKHLGLSIDNMGRRALGLVPQLKACAKVTWAQPYWKFELRLPQPVRVL